MDFTQTRPWLSRLGFSGKNLGALLGKLSRFSATDRDYLRQLPREEALGFLKALLGSGLTPMEEDKHPVRKEDTLPFSDSMMDALADRLRVKLKLEPASYLNTLTLQERGQEVLNKAPVHLVVPDSTKGDQWMTQQASAWQAVQGNVRLTEAERNGVQHWATRLLASPPGPCTLRAVDTHTAASVCGPSLKPDVVFIPTGAQYHVPLNTGIIGAWKRQDEPYMAAENVGKVLLYGEKMLCRLPHELRSSVLVFLSDLRRITWFRVKRNVVDGVSSFTYDIGVEHDNVAASLCGAMGMTTEQLDLTPPLLKHLREKVEVLDYLGQGATSFVYKVKPPADLSCDEEFLVAKQPRHHGALLKDRAALEALSGISGVPKLWATCEDESLLLSPLGKVVSSECLDQESAPDLCQQLCSTLQQVHSRGWVNRDIRPSNIIEVGGSTVVIDWGTAMRTLQAATAFSGGVHCASDNVLQQLAAGRHVQYNPSDDLVALVRTMFVLRYPTMHRGLSHIKTDDVDKIKQLWSRWLATRPRWRELEALAMEVKYEQLGNELSSQMQ
eukprot:CAMPEP_0202895636 /NCGR_PEP_ID=MMETSP1392-20130828/4785_1 /ASSEMBLY_ACC=CAM_ASM_000868 /TAXON_ID=225041 /ORGANISM="Chlamydomonas chlamydogama, Strain SAG 11-48b" /LENGTH=554 /DNA_ID=CAMNT_0049580703 /DNA_START=472 /DNA_END=2136 /DNA_ORIENTATION=-